MGTGEIIGMSIFGFLVLCGLAAAIWQGARQREQVARYSTGRGFRVLPPGYAPLEALLEQATPDSDWSTSSVMLVEPAPRGVYLFGYSVSSKHGRSRPSNGYAALAAHDAHRIESPLTISRRIPGLDSFAGDRVAVGGEEFRGNFTVTCTHQGTAMVTVNPDIERILLEHIAGPGWYMTATIAASSVLVESSWAQTEQEWDYLISLARRLRAAVR
jgi:hypothetical protein